MHTSDEIRIGIIGLGYVGLPVAVAFHKPQAILFDIKSVLFKDKVEGRL